MAHQLRTAFRKGADQVDQFGRAESARDLEAREMAGGLAAMSRQDALEPRAQQAQRAAGQALQRRNGQRVEGKIERPAHPNDAELLADPSHGVENRRRQVRVLMGIEMRGAHSGVQNAPDLGAQLVEHADLAAGHGREQFRDGRRKRLAGQRRTPSHQYQMRADIERGSFARQPHGVVEPLAIRHQRGCRENAAAMRFHNPLVHVGREAEIVGVDHQLFS